MTTQTLTDRQRDVWDFVCKFWKTEDRMPSTHEVAKQFGMESQTGAIYQLNTLAKKGYLERRSSIHRSHQSWWRFNRDHRPEGSHE